MVQLGGYANRENLLSECGRFRLSREQASSGIDEVLAVVRSRWRAVCWTHGVTDAECELLAPTFAYPGFELDPAQVLGSRL